MRFTAVATIQEKPEPKVDRKDKGVFIKFRGTSTTSRQFKTFDKDGNEIKSRLTSNFFNVWISNKADGSPPEKLIERLTKPGENVYLEGDIYQVKSAKGDYFTNLDVTHFSLIFNDREEGEATPAPQSGGRRTRPAATPQPVPAMAVDDNDSIPF